MKNDLTCGVVGDLLPGFVEGLLGPESQAAVERHLASCPACAARLEAMSAPTEAPPETRREVDYLKGVKRRNRRRVLAAVLATAAGLLAVFLLKIFIIGTPLQAQMTAVTGAEAEGGVLHLSVCSLGSADAFHSWRVETQEGVACVYARDVLVSGLFQDGCAAVEVPLEGVREVWLGGLSGRLVWQEGMVISKEALDLLDARTDYCGDAPGLGRIAECLGFQERLGAYTMSIKTSSRPYVWTLDFEEAPGPGQRAWLQRAQLLMLALVGNLDEVQCRFPEETLSLTLDQATQSLPALTEAYNASHDTDWPVLPNLRDCTQSPAVFQRLLAILP